MNIYSIDIFYNTILGVEKNIFVENIEANNDVYRTFFIPKKNGKREINLVKSDTFLKNMQLKLKNNLLDDISLPIPVKGFVKGESYKSFLEEHCGMKFFFRIDIEDFFGSIGQEHIHNAFNEFIKTSKNDKSEILMALEKIILYKEKLPQGSILSPVISNMVFSRIDQRILKYCQVLNIKYTRYADDLLFSSEKFSFKEKKWFLKKIKYILLSNNFKLNYSKIKFAEDEISLNGFVIESDIRLSRKRFRDIDKIIQIINHVYCKPEDMEKLLEELNSIELIFREEKFHTRETLLQYLLGHRAYLLGWYNGKEFFTKEVANQKRIIDTINAIEKCVNSIDAFDT